MDSIQNSFFCGKSLYHRMVSYLIIMLLSYHASCIIATKDIVRKCPCFFNGWVWMEGQQNMLGFKLIRQISRLQITSCMLNGLNCFNYSFTIRKRKPIKAYKIIIIPSWIFCTWTVCTSHWGNNQVNKTNVWITMNEIDGRSVLLHAEMYNNL